MPKININLDDLSSNLNTIRNFIGENVKILPMIKSEGYCLGQSAVLDVLIKNSLSEFYTFSLADAIRCRLFINKYHNNKKIDIYVVMGLSNGEEEFYYKYNLIPTINNKEQFNLWKNFSISKNEQLNCIVQFNTGMNRSGFEYFLAEEIKQMFQENKDNLSIKYIISHLCCADEPENFMNERQRKNLMFIREYFNTEKVCFTASEGMVIGKEYFFDAVRIFHALIKPINYKDNKLNLKQVFSITANIINIDKDIATIDIGENNNYKKELLTNKNLSVLIKNKKYKVLDIEEKITKIKIDNSIKINDEVIITSNDLYSAELVENGVKIGASEILLLLCNINKNIINYTGNYNNKYENIINEDVLLVENFRKIKQSDNKIKTFISEKRIIESEDEYVGYSIKYKAKKHDVLLVLPIGYFDGLIKYKVFEGDIKFICNGIECLCAGNPSMNQITLRTTYENKDKINIGDVVYVEL